MALTAGDDLPQIFWPSKRWWLSQMIHGAGIFGYISPMNDPNVGKYTIHGSFGYMYCKSWWNTINHDRPWTCGRYTFYNMSKINQQWQVPVKIGRLTNSYHEYYQKLRVKMGNWSKLTSENGWLVVWNILYYSIYCECHHPNWPIFFRGVFLTNQKWVNHLLSWKSNPVTCPCTWVTAGAADAAAQAGSGFFRPRG